MLGGTLLSPQSMRAGSAKNVVALPSKVEGYQLGKKIGNRVWEAVVIETGTEVVVKSIAFDVTKNPAKTAKVEQALEHFIKTISHPHMVKSLHSFYVDKELWIIEDTRGWEDTTLRSLYPGSDQARPLPESVIAALIRPVLLALQYLHASGRAWSDVRGKNMFVQHDGHVLINLVTLRSVVQEKTRDSLPFVAPEMLQSSEFNTSGKVDVWSLGIAVLELANNATPYVLGAESTPQQITQRILTEPPPLLRDDLPWQWSAQLVDFLSHCLVRDPALRATADDLLRHPFITNAPAAEYLVEHLLSLYQEPLPLNPVTTAAAGNDPLPAALFTSQTSYQAPHTNDPQAQSVLNTPTLSELSSAPLPPSATIAPQHQPTPSSAPGPLPSTPTAMPLPVHSAIPANLANERKLDPKRKSDPTPENPPFVPPPLYRGGSASSQVGNSGDSSAVVSPSLTPIVAPKPIPALGPVNAQQLLAAQQQSLVQLQGSQIKSASPPLMNIPVINTGSRQTPSQSQTVALLGAANVPVETTLAESAFEFVVFLRTLPSTKVALRLESRTLVIAGELPALQLGDGSSLPEDLVLLDALQTKFEKRIVFPNDIDPNSVRKVLDKESSMMTIRIRKFSHRDLGSDEF